MARSTRSTVALTWVLVAVSHAHAQRVPCRDGADAARIAEALGRIRRSVDPCGESADVAGVLVRLARCPSAICTSVSADRNLFDRRTITWNPELPSELESVSNDASAAPHRARSGRVPGARTR